MSPLASTNLVGELQHYFNQLIINSLINKHQIPHPVDIAELYFLNNNSFIRLLFDNDWDESEYKYLFIENDSRLSWPQQVKDRMLIYPSSAKYYELSATTGENFFSLHAHDLILLDALLQYRADSTSVTLIDAAGPTWDSTSYILTTQIDDLETDLSKLIYLFLIYKINDDFTLYNNTTVYSDEDNMLASMYEVYLIEEYFRDISITRYTFGQGSGVTVAKDDVSECVRLWATVRFH